VGLDVNGMCSYIGLVCRNRRMWDWMTYRGVCRLGRPRKVYGALDVQDRRM
jgi:hypothetical protein